MTTRTQFDPVELESLKASMPLTRLFDQLGYKPRGRVCLCPFHREKTGSCSIDDRKRLFYCHGCGEGGDHFDLLMKIRGLTFVEAVEEMGGVRPVTQEERERIERDQKRIEREDQEARERILRSAQGMFDRASPIEGTLAAAYLAKRGLPVDPSWTFDLRYISDLNYRGYLDDQAVETVDLGRFPAMVAAIRNEAGTIIGVHRTYLDLEAPAKLVPPGDTKRNRAKKILGEQRGGLIWLSKPSASLALGEGIETTRAWFMGGYGGDDVSIAAAISLGNLAGRSTGTVAHPNNPKLRIPNGIPDLEHPGITLPEMVEEVTLLVDGDSDPPMTRQRIVCAGRRFLAQKKTVFAHPAPDGQDWNDVWMERRSNGA